MLILDKIYWWMIYSPGGNNHFSPHFSYFPHLFASWCDITSERPTRTIVSSDPTSSEVIKNKQKTTKTKTKLKTMKTLHLLS